MPAGEGRWRFSGSGFVVPGGVVTASHVVRDKRADQVRVEVGGFGDFGDSGDSGDFSVGFGVGAAWPVREIVADAGLDVAWLRIDGLPATRLATARCDAGAAWIVTSRPTDADPQLSGQVTAVGRAVVNQGGHAVDVLQLGVVQLLKDYSGYSGSAVRLASWPDVVIGVLCEQVRTRFTMPGVSRAPAANVLYAVSEREAEARLGFALPTRYPDLEQLIDGGELANADTAIGRLLRTDDGNASLWELRSRIALAQHNTDVARQYLYRSLERDPRHLVTIVALIRVLLVSNGETERDEARRLADRSHGFDGTLDTWLDCLAAHGVFEPGIRSAAELDERCPWDGGP